ncbi:MAG: dihydroorotase [Candidatus Berkiella sp.]
MQTIEIIYPDDWHCHLRDGAALSTTVPDIAKQFRRAIVMPNLIPPVTTVEMAFHYRERISAHIPKGNPFTPLMTLYLTDNTSTQTILEAKKSGFVMGCKLYPAGVTTNSASGVTTLENCIAVFEAMSEVGLPLLIHGEVNDPKVDIFDREAFFIEKHLIPLIQQFPKLKVVLEHITTEQAVKFVTEAPKNVAATITPHHLLMNRNDMLVGGIRPHHYCLPILKRQTHQMALLKAATSGNPKFFLGTDSAPHAKMKKEAACGCAGVYNAYSAIELYAKAFEQLNALDKLEGFASRFGPAFYDLPVNTDKITLRKSAWTLPASLPFADETLIPFYAGETLEWKCTHDK